MKRKLLSGALLLGSIIVANAQSTQDVIITSFESTETAGYEVGADLSSYSTIWDTYNGQSQAAVETGAIVVSDTWASDGTQSIKFAAMNGGSATNFNQLYSPIYNFSTIADADFQVGLDFSTNVVSNTSSNLVFNIYTYAGTGSTPVRVSSAQFDYSGEIFFWDATASQLEVDNYGYQSAGVEFAAGQNYNLKVGFNADGSISYFVNGESVYTFTPDTAVDFVANRAFFTLLVDDYTSDWYADKYAVTIPTGSVKEQSLSQFSVYPNPANNVINVSSDKALVNAVSLVDINGRTVKSVQFDGVYSAQVNIADLANGVYMMNIKSDKGTVTKKVVKN